MPSVWTFHVHICFYLYDIYLHLYLYVTWCEETDHLTKELIFCHFWSTFLFGFSQKNWLTSDWLSLRKSHSLLKARWAKHNHWTLKNEAIQKLESCDHFLFIELAMFLFSFWICTWHVDYPLLENELRKRNRN